MARKGSAVEQFFFQANSALGKGMEQAFQAAINFVAGIDYSNIADKDKVGYRRTQTHNYARMTLFPALQKVIRDTTNLEIDKVVDVNRFCGYFAIDIGLDAYEEVIAILQNQSGTGVKPTPLDETAKEIADFAEKVDQVNAKLTATLFGKGLSRKISATLFMDVDMALLMQDNLPVDYVDSFTASELTGIYLHEVGHMLTMLYQAANSYAEVETIRGHLKSFQSVAGDPKKFVEVYTKAVRPMLADGVTKKTVNPEILDKSDKLIESVKYYEQAKTDDWGWGTAELVWQLFSKYMMIYCMIWSRIIMMNFILPFYWIATWFIGNPGDKGKVSDVGNSPRAFYRVERMADDFAAKQGYGGQLAQGLSKLLKAIEAAETMTFAGNKVHTYTLRKSKVFMYTLKFIVGYRAALRINGEKITRDFMGHSNYEADTDRLLRVIQQITAAFKNDLPRELSNHYLGELAAAKAALEDTKSKTRAISDFIWKYFLDTEQVLGRLLQTDQPKEIEQMLNELDTVINNELYVRAAEFKHMR